MKRTIRTNLNSLWAMVLAFLMIFSVFAPTVMAAENLPRQSEEESSKKKITYVSLGDSMTNGYGLDGYEFKYYWDGSKMVECTEKECNHTHAIWGDANGFRQIAWDAYPNLFAEWLKTNGNEVTHDQLAMAGMTSDMMRWILEFPINPEDPNHDLAMEIITMEEWSFVECDDETHTGCSDCLMSNGKSVVENWRSIWDFGDFHTFDQGPDSARMEKSFPDWLAPGWNSLGASNDAVAEYIKLYQDSVKNADIISLCIGNGDFGNHMLNRIMWLLVGATDHELKYNMDYAIGSLTEDQQAFILNLQENLKDLIIVPDVPKENSDRVIECMLYTTMSYIVNFDGIMAQINKMNPNAEIVLLGMVESMKGVTIRLEDGSFLPLGDIMDECIKLGNMYLAGRVLELQENEIVTNPVYFAEANEDVDMIYETYSTEVYRPENLVVRDRFFGSIDDQHERILDYLGKEVLGDPNADFCDGKFNLNDIKAYEDAGYTTTGVYGNAFELYLGFEKAIVEAGKDGALTIEGLALVYGDMDEIRKPGYAHVKDAILDWQAGNTNMPLREVVAEALLGNINTKSVMYQYCRMNVGNFLGNHPTVDGHKVLFDAVVKAYEGKYTPADKTIENAIYLITEYYDEAYAYGYTYADANGYVDAAVAALESAIAAVETTDVSGTEMTEEFKSALNAELAAVVATLEELKAVLEADAAADVDGLVDTVLALEDDLYTHLENALALLEQAGVDTVELALAPALEAAVEEAKILAELVAEKAAEELGVAYDALVDATVEAVKKYAPEAAAWVYNYLLNNPEEVIEFVKEYGPYVVALVAEYGEEIVAVLGYVAENYGEEIVKFLLDNHKEILGGLVYLVSEYGDEAWALVEVYAEATGLTAAVEAGLAEIKNAVEAEIKVLEGELVALKAELETKINETKAALEAALAEKRAQLADLLAKVEEGIDEAEAALIEMLEGEIAKIEAMIAELDAAIAAIEAKIAEAEAKIAALIAELEEICAEIAKVVEKVNALNDALANLVEEAKAAMNGAVADLNGAVEDVKAALDALVSELEGDIAERIAEIADKAAEAAALAAEKLAELEAVVAEKVAEAVA
ncbi:MAG: hypothetical protein IJX92_07430, partial [Clostridia bacterium]|nr:hypothetical protein [Clostridia bacterium]